MAKQQTVGFMELEERYAGYKVYDRDGEKIGKVDELFVDENDRPEYIGVKMDFLGTKSTLIPMDVVRVRENRRIMEVSEIKDKIKEALRVPRSGVPPVHTTAGTPMRAFLHGRYVRTTSERSGRTGSALKR